MIVYNRTRSSRRKRHALIGAVIVKVRTGAGRSGFVSLMREKDSSSAKSVPCDFSPPTLDDPVILGALAVGAEVITLWGSTRGGYGGYDKRIGSGFPPF